MGSVKQYWLILPTGTLVSTQPRFSAFVFQVPDEVHQVLLIEIARGLGLRAFARPRSRRRVWVCGAKPEVDAVAATARRLAGQLQTLQMRALGEVLEKNGLRVSPNLLKLVSEAESETPAPATHQPLRRERGASERKEGSNESNSH
jgi:hypothetical protein